MAALVFRLRADFRVRVDFGRPLFFFADRDFVCPAILRMI